VKLGEICEFKYGKALKATDRSGTGAPVYGSNGVVGFHSRALTSGPTIIVGRKGSYGEIHRAEQGCWPIDTTYYIDETSTDADLRWLAHLLSSLGLTNLNRAAAVPGLNREDAYRLPLLLPPKVEQRRLALVLDRVEALQAKRRQVATVTRACRRGLFDVAARGAPQHPLGEVLRDAELFTDGDWVESKDQDPDGEVRLVQLADVEEGNFADRSARFLTRETARKLSCTYLREGDVLIARLPVPLGRACLFPGAARTCVTAVDICIARPSPEGVDPVWLMHALNTPESRARVLRRATGTTRVRISRSNLAKVPIPMASRKAQSAFRRQIRALEHARLGSRSHLAHLDELFASLQHHAFTGQL
jgi:type I restriction enzyme S subunit